MPHVARTGATGGANQTFSHRIAGVCIERDGTQLFNGFPHVEQLRIGIGSHREFDVRVPHRSLAVRGDADAFENQVPNVVRKA